MITREELYETSTKPTQISDGSIYMYNRPKVPFSDLDHKDHKNKLQINNAKPQINPFRAMKPVGYYLNETPIRTKMYNDKNTETLIRKTTADSSPKKEYLDERQAEIKVYQCECTQDFEGNVIVFHSNTNQQKINNISTTRKQYTSSTNIKHLLLETNNTKSESKHQIQHPYTDRNADRPRIPFNSENSKDHSREELEPDRRLNRIPDTYPQKLEDFSEGYRYDRPKNPMRLPNELR